MKLFRDRILDSKNETIGTLLLILVGTLLFSPLFVSVNDLMTRSVVQSGAYVWVKEYVVPVQMRWVAVVLYPFGLKPEVMGNYLAVGRGEKLLIEIAWNCVGWQSVVIFLLTSVITLKAREYTYWSKMKAWVFGLLGTVLMNIFRIAFIVILAHTSSAWVARVVHDYGSNILIILWMVFLWWFAYKYLLEQKTPLE